ncbi:hypothetical protein, partial [Paraburkholderia ginsengiterrae]|uniref:hypothetical protein n=1 Tax=Paraburkholderia ginsengiterrae TaxID=1462993 RepID=UPI000B07D907
STLTPLVFVIVHVRTFLPSGSVPHVVTPPLSDPFALFDSTDPHRRKNIVDNTSVSITAPLPSRAVSVQHNFVACHVARHEVVLDGHGS